MANPHDGSKKRVAQEEKEPAMGKMTASSPRAWHVQNNIAPTMEKATSKEAGPPVANALPDATKRPVPIMRGATSVRIKGLERGCVAFTMKEPRDAYL